MSHEVYVDYELERRRQRELYLARIKVNTESYLNKFRTTYDDMVKKNYVDIMPDEMGNLNSDLNKIETLLYSNNIEEARRVSEAVGRYIYGLHTLAKSIYEKQFVEQQLQMKREREEKQAQISTTMEMYYKIVAAIKDPVVASLASGDLQKLRVQIQNGKITEDKIRNTVKTIIQSVTPKAEAWKKQVKKEKAKEIVAAEIKDKIEEVAKQKVEDKNKQDELIRQLQQLQEDVQNGKVTAEQAEETAKDVEEKHIVQATNEDVRRETVKAIYKQLLSQGFTVQKPKLKEDGYVYIRASMPAGQQAACKISIDGKCKYRFDHYSGMTCLKDIEKFNVDLEKIYSVKFSDERVIWSNPDRIQKDAEGNVTTIRRNA